MNRLHTKKKKFQKKITTTNTTTTTTTTTTGINWTTNITNNFDTLPYTHYSYLRRGLYQL